MRVKYYSILGDVISSELEDYVSGVLTNSSENGTIEQLREQVYNLADALGKVVTALASRDLMTDGEIRRIIDPYHEKPDLTLVDD